MDFYPRFDWDGDESSFNNHILVLVRVPSIYEYRLLTTTTAFCLLCEYWTTGN